MSGSGILVAFKICAAEICFERCFLSLILSLSLSLTHSQTLSLSLCLSLSVSLSATTFFVLILARDSKTIQDIVAESVASVTFTAAL